MTARQRAEEGIRTALAAITAMTAGDTFLANAVLGSLEDDSPEHRAAATGFLAATVVELLRCYTADHDLDPATVLQDIALAYARGTA